MTSAVHVSKGRLTGADPESGKREGHLAEKKLSKKKKKKVTTIIASYPLLNILYHVCYVK